MNIQPIFRSIRVLCSTILIGSLLFGCGGNNNKTIQEGQTSRDVRMKDLERKRDSLRSLKEELAFHNRLSLVIDTGDYHYTYEYQNHLEQGNFFLVTDYVVRDIIKESDSLYRVALHTGVLNLKFFNLVLSEPLAEKFLALIEEPYRWIAIPDSDNPFLKISVTGVRKLKFDPVSYTDIGVMSMRDSDEGSLGTVSSYHHFVFTGSIVDVISGEWLKNDVEEEIVGQQDTGEITF